MLNVTKTFFPNLEDYITQLNIIWENKWLTNRGELVNSLESQLKSYLGINNIILMNNGTIPIQIALKLLAENGDVITTPFSYIATSASILWQNCVPIFVDIDPEYLTIDEKKIENAITSKTKCILATHVFGNPCNIEAIDTIAKKHNLKVIYDAAHCFGVKYKGKAIFEYGDISTCSFHATKIFHTGEGGALFTNNIDLFQKSFYSHNFGHNGPLDFHGLGINGKISELQAAMGICVLDKIDLILEKREKTVNFYNKNLNYKTFSIREGTNWNYSYYPYIFKNENDLFKAQIQFSKLNIFPRRYFYPSLNTVKFINGNKMPISEDIASRIMCLPLSHDYNEESLGIICNILNNIL
jgi:dTDP-4-amino-4,6-dideoxygalactose transaminase